MSEPLQHSPGPWTYDGESVWDADNCYVCSRVTPGNGRVIAAAPDMLRLLRVLVPISESGAEDRKGWMAWMAWNAAFNEASELIARLDGQQP